MLRNTFLRQNGRFLQQFRYSSTRETGAPPLINNEPIPIIDFEDRDDLPLPVYPDKPNEPLHQRKQRLLYQSRKRGMLENDLLLSTFAAKYLGSWDADTTARYDKLINGVSNDWDIYYWATETKPTPAEFDDDIMKLLKEHVRNAQKEKRLRQPDLGNPFQKEN